MLCTWQRVVVLGLLTSLGACSGATIRGDGEMDPPGAGGDRAAGTGGSTGTGGSGVRPDGAAGGTGTPGTGGAGGTGGTAAGTGGSSPSSDAGLLVPPSGVFPGGGGVPEQAWIFDDTSLKTYTFTVTPGDLLKMQENAFKNFGTPLEGTYVPATLNVAGEDVGKVGVRHKGAWGTLKGCFDSTGKLICPKLSMRVKFNELEMDKRWRGITGLNLHGLARDQTLLHERLGYKLFREMGIPAPRSVHARIVINGEYKGVFAVTELVNGRFTTDRFPKVGDGNLLKEAWPQSGDDNYYKTRLKTNEDMPKVPYKTKTLYNELLMAGSNTTELQRVVDKWMDMKYLLRYIAVDTAINNWDGIVTYYCGADGRSCGNHNFFIYEAERADRVYLMPWDLDSTFALTSHIDPVAPWNAPPSDCNMRYRVGTNMLMSPGCSPVFRAATAAGKPAFQAAAGELLAGPFQVAKMQADLDRWAAQIKDAVMTDKTQNLTGWQGAVESFKTDLVTIREKMEAIRDGKTTEPHGLRLDANNDFENISRVSFLLGASRLANGATTFGHTLNNMAPIAGSNDARIDFEFRNDMGVPWSWGFTVINMRGGPQSLAGVKQIRLKMKTNATRGVRLELESPRNTVAGGGRWGWEVRFPAAGGTVTVDLATIGIATWANGKAAGPKDEVLANVSGLAFNPAANGYDSKGFFTAGSDKGWLQIDDIEFVR